MPADDLQVRLSRVTSPHGTCLTASVSVAGALFEASSSRPLASPVCILGGLKDSFRKKESPLQKRASMPSMF